MSDPLTPIFRTTTAAIDKADPALAVTVTVAGHPVTYVEMTPSQAPDPGEVHQMGVNAATPLVDNRTVNGAATMLPLQIQLNDRLNTTSRHMATKVYLKSGKDGTTFDVVGIL